MPVPDNGRYKLHNEIDDCIVCDLCAKVCPVNCIEIEPIKATDIIGKTSDGTNKRIHAAKFDIETSLGLSTEALSQIWDREDSFLDYAWKSTEQYLDRVIEQYKADRDYDIEEDRLDFDQDTASGRTKYELMKIGYDVVFGGGDDIFDWFS